MLSPCHLKSALLILERVDRFIDDLFTQTQRIGPFSLDSFRIFLGFIFKLICMKMSLPLRSNSNWLYWFTLFCLPCTRVYLLIINLWTFGLFSLEGQLNGYKVESQCGLNLNDVPNDVVEHLQRFLFFSSRTFWYFSLFKNHYWFVKSSRSLLHIISNLPVLFCGFSFNIMDMVHGCTQLLLCFVYIWYLCSVFSKKLMSDLCSQSL